MSTKETTRELLGLDKVNQVDYVAITVANPDAIRLHFGGDVEVSLTPDGDLALRSNGAQVLQKAPVIYQDNRPIKGRYTLLAHNQAGFRLDRYDRTRPLVIDPILLYCAYWGSSGADRINAMKMGANGLLYITGQTNTSEMPWIDGAYDNYNFGQTDIFLAIVDTTANGNFTLKYFSYLGGSLDDIPLALVRFMLEGKPGTTVTITVVRPFKPDPDKITLTRTVPATPALGEQLYENATILYLKPGVLTAARVDDLAVRIKGAGKGRKILLDLRDTTGGDPKQGLRLANFFLKQGTLGSLVGQKFPVQTFTADPAQWLTDAPVAVLVNRGTYGAPELTAAAIEGLKRGDVVGERTFGEGSVQKTIDLPDGGALMLTIAKYETPAGKKIEDEAVTPTLVVSSPQDTGEPMPASNGDEQLNQALSLLKAKTS